MADVVPRGHLHRLLSYRAADVLKDVASLELIQAPGLPSIVPKEYDTYPRLTGAAL